MRKVDRVARSLLASLTHHTPRRGKRSVRVAVTRVAGEPPAGSRRGAEGRDGI